LLDDLGAGATDQLDQRGRVRHRPVQADTANRRQAIESLT
jgi:hypothetical protein